MQLWILVAALTVVAIVGALLRLLLKTPGLGFPGRRLKGDDAGPADQEPIAKWSPGGRTRFANISRDYMTVELFTPGLLLRIPSVDGRIWIDVKGIRDLLRVRQGGFNEHDGVRLIADNGSLWLWLDDEQRALLESWWVENRAKYRPD